ncbi:MAG TPA: hypothetical protein VM934_01210 [Pyrinomonadaceae bacterium]|jgi:hypothetical protein|nr:hypothetical protein [Pyrinomonadaceae bacterium]
MGKTTKKSLPARTTGKRASVNGTKGAVKEIDTSRRYTKKELEQMPLDDLTLLAYRMTYDRIHGKRKAKE